MKERIVIIFIAVTIGLILTTFGFFLYESTKPAKKESPKPTTTQKTTKTQDEILLSINEPVDEFVTTKRTIAIKGKTNPSNTLIISTNQEDTVAIPTSSGSFSTTISIDTGINKIIIKAITENGDEKTVTKTVSFSPDDF